MHLHARLHVRVTPFPIVVECLARLWRPPFASRYALPIALGCSNLYQLAGTSADSDLFSVGPRNDHPNDLTFCTILLPRDVLRI